MADLIYRKKLIEHLPPFMQQFAEIKEIMEAEDASMEIIQSRTANILDNAFIKDCGIQGIKRYENMLGIMPDITESLEGRKQAVLMQMNNKPPYTYRTLLKKLEALYGEGNYEVSGDLKMYSIDVTVHSELRGQKKILETMLGWFLPVNILFSAKNEVLRHFIIYMQEEMDITKLCLHTQFFFWSCDILNGTRLLEGSVFVDARKRYNLVLGIKNRIKSHIKESMDTDRVYIKILSCFNAHENIYSANVIQSAISFWQSCSHAAGSAVAVTKTRHMAGVQVSETVGDVTITYRRNLHYLDGSKTLDGSCLVNAFYGKEEV